MQEINLIPNCSEATFRIDVSRLGGKTKQLIRKTWEQHVKEYMADQSLDNEPEGSQLSDKTIFGRAVLEADGDFPYSCNEIVEAIVADIESKIGKKLITDSDR